MCCVEAQSSRREQTPLDPAVSPWRVTTLWIYLISLKMATPPERRGRSFNQMMKIDQFVVIRHQTLLVGCWEVNRNISVCRRFIVLQVSMISVRFTEKPRSSLYLIRFTFFTEFEQTATHLPTVISKRIDKINLKNRVYCYHVLTEDDLYQMTSTFT